MLESLFWFEGYLILRGVWINIKNECFSKIHNFYNNGLK